LTEHVHEWTVERTRPATHFADVPNSRRLSRPVLPLVCACGWRGFRYGLSRVVYTWNPDPTQWEE
jgi:hypothetical protein